MASAFEHEDLKKSSAKTVRADGRIMKIHTTTDSISELMRAFFTGE